MAAAAAAAAGQAGGAGAARPRPALLCWAGVAAILAAASPAAGQTLHERHQAAGVGCATCHAEAPPRAAPADAACTVCHGAMRSRPASGGPDPHASPHLAPDEVPACQECHHVHRPSEVSCAACHRSFRFRIE